MWTSFGEFAFFRLYAARVVHAISMFRSVRAMPVQNASRIGARLARRIGQCLDAAMVEIRAAVRHDVRPFAAHAPRPASLTAFAAAILAPFLRLPRISFSIEEADASVAPFVSSMT
jgi:hypothetical protein